MTEKTTIVVMYVPACVAADRRRAMMRASASTRIRNIHIIDQSENGPVAHACATRGLNLNACGFIACAAASHAAQHAQPTMSEAQLDALIAELRDASSMQPRIEAVMEWVQSCRRRYIESLPAEFPTEAAKAAFLGDVVREPEVSAWLRCGEHAENAQHDAAVGSLHVLRSVQLGPSRLGMIRWGDVDSDLKEIEHEDERRFTREEAPLRTPDGADWFFESALDRADALPAHVPADEPVPTMLPPAPTALRASDEWAAAVGATWERASGGTCILVNWWGHWGVYVPVNIVDAPPTTEAGEEPAIRTTPTLLVLNSIATEDESLQACEVLRCCFDIPHDATQHGTMQPE